MVYITQGIQKEAVIMEACVPLTGENVTASDT